MKSTIAILLSIAFLGLGSCSDSGIDYRSSIQSAAHRKSDSPTAICKDGTYSYSKNRRGTCSHHGGVEKWINLP